jgi:hypothetical protein
MTPSSLEHLAARLERFEHPSCAIAASKVRRAIDAAARFDRPDAEQALAHEIWGHLETALEDAEGATATALEALRAEMAGYVYTARLALGWITRASASPDRPPTLADLGL